MKMSQTVSWSVFGNGSCEVTKQPTCVSSLVPKGSTGEEGLALTGSGSSILKCLYSILGLHGINRTSTPLTETNIE